MTREMMNRLKPVLAQYRARCGIVFLASFFLLPSSFFLESAALAADYPSRPIRWVTPYPAGGSFDTVSRALAQRMSERLKQQVVVDNRTGAGGTVGTEIGAKSPPDGYTIVSGGEGTLVVSPILRKDLPYDSLKDFSPITQLASINYILFAHPSVPFRTVSELIAMAKAKPGQLNYASGGTGSAPHMLGELFKYRTGVNIQHVSYKGSSPAINDVMGGHVQLMFTGLPSVLAQIQAGKLRGIAVTSRQRLVSVPDVPTFAEAGVKNFEASPWFGALAPAHTPTTVIDRLHREFAAVLKEAPMREFLSKGGVEAVGSTPAEFAAHIRHELKEWKEVITRAGIRAD
jgi:tripartite-type tricarboxylate transporter receptor subunit TctC